MHETTKIVVAVIRRIDVTYHLTVVKQGTVVKSSSGEHNGFTFPKDAVFRYENNPCLWE